MRKWNAGFGTRPEAGRGKGMRDAELEARRGAERNEEEGSSNERECHSTPNRKSASGIPLPDPALCRVPIPHSPSAPRLGSFSESRIPLPPPAPGRVPDPAFLFRAPPRVEFRIPHSTSALRLGSSSESRIPLPHSASGRVPDPALHFRTPRRVEALPLGSKHSPSGRSTPPRAEIPARLFPPPNPVRPFS